MNWKGKTAIVTGASGGIGSAICRRLASMQMNLVITGRKLEMLDSLAGELNDMGAKTLVCKAVLYI